MPDERELGRDELIAQLANTSHQTWMRQAARDRGVPFDQLGSLPTEHDRERAADTVASLERLGLYGVNPRRSRAALLRHPLVVGSVIAAVSALFASLLIPSITQVAQDRPKELELKRQIQDKVATSTAHALTRGVALSRGDALAAGGRSGDTVPTAYRKVIGDWRVDAAIIDAELLTYFTGSEAQHRWAPFEHAVEAFLQLEAITDQQERQVVARYLRRYLASDVPRYRRIPWDDLALARADPHHWAEAIQALLLDKRDAIMADISRTQASGFKHSPWSF